MPSSDGVIADAVGLSVKSHNGGFHEHLWPAIDQALTAVPRDRRARRGHQARPRSGDRDHRPGAVRDQRPVRRDLRRSARARCRSAWTRSAPRTTGRAAPRRIAARGWSWSPTTPPTPCCFTPARWPTARRCPPTWIPRSLGDPNLLGLWDRAFKDDGSPAHFFWDIARVDSSQLLRPPVTLDKNSPAFDHSTTATFDVTAIIGKIDHITARIRIRPLTHALLDDLVGSGDLAADVASRLPTLDILGTQRTWSADPTTHQPGTNCGLH